MGMFCLNKAAADSFFISAIQMSWFGSLCGRRMAVKTMRWYQVGWYQWMVPGQETNR